MTGRAEGEPQRVEAGFIADGYCGSFRQWCEENPKASRQEVIRTARLLLTLADRAEARRRNSRGGDDDC